MNKKRILEQLNRAKAGSEDEKNLHVKLDQKLWIGHQDGHIRFIKDMEDYLNTADSVNKKQIKGILKALRQEANSKISELDYKYNNFQKNEEMTPEEEYTYGFWDGVICYCDMFDKVLRRQFYYNKDYYTPTDWVKEGLIKE